MNCTDGRRSRFMDDFVSCKKYVVSADFCLDLIFKEEFRVIIAKVSLIKKMEKWVELK